MLTSHQPTNRPLQGGAGFIGSHAVLELVKEGHCVTIVVSLGLGKERVAGHRSPRRRRG